jgi:hypothetical protein
MHLMRQWFGGVAAARIRQMREQWKRSLVLTGVLVACAVVALGGLGFMAAAAYLALRAILLPWQAALVIGGAALLLALVGALLARSLLARSGSREAPEPDTPAPHPDASPVENIAELGRTLGRDLSQYGIRTSDVMLGALLAGTLLGASPALRDRLFGRRGSPRNSAVRNPDRRTRCR